MKTDNYYIEDGCVVSECGYRIKLKKFEQSGKCCCQSCGRYLPRHVVLKEYYAKQRAQNKAKARGFKI